MVYMRIGYLLQLRGALAGDVGGLEVEWVAQRRLGEQLRLSLQRGGEEALALQQTAPHGTVHGILNGHDADESGLIERQQVAHRIQHLKKDRKGIEDEWSGPLLTGY